MSKYEIWNNEINCAGLFFGQKIEKYALPVTSYRSKNIFAVTRC